MICVDKDAPSCKGYNGRSDEISADQTKAQSTSYSDI